MAKFFEYDAETGVVSFNPPNPRRGEKDPDRYRGKDVGVEINPGRFSGPSYNLFLERVAAARGDSNLFGNPPPQPDLPRIVPETGEMQRRPSNPWISMGRAPLGYSTRPPRGGDDVTQPTDQSPTMPAGGVGGGGVGGDVSGTGAVDYGGSVFNQPEDVTVSGGNVFSNFGSRRPEANTGSNVPFEPLPGTREHVRGAENRLNNATDYLLQVTSGQKRLGDPDFTDEDIQNARDELTAAQQARKDASKAFQDASKQKNQNILNQFGPLGDALNARQRSLTGGDVRRTIDTDGLTDAVDLSNKHSAGAFGRTNEFSVPLLGGQPDNLETLGKVNNLETAVDTTTAADVELRQAPLKAPTKAQYNALKNIRTQMDNASNTSGQERRGRSTKNPGVTSYPSDSYDVDTRTGEVRDQRTGARRRDLDAAGQAMVEDRAAAAKGQPAPVEQVAQVLSGKTDEATGQNKRTSTVDASKYRGDRHRAAVKRVERAAASDAAGTGLEPTSGEISGSKYNPTDPNTAAIHEQILNQESADEIAGIMFQANAVSQQFENVPPGEFNTPPGLSPDDPYSTKLIGQVSELANRAIGESGSPTQELGQRGSKKQALMEKKRQRELAKGTQGELPSGEGS